MKKKRTDLKHVLSFIMAAVLTFGGNGMPTVSGEEAVLAEEFYPESDSEYDVLTEGIITDTDSGEKTASDVVILDDMEDDLTGDSTQDEDTWIEDAAGDGYILEDGAAEDTFVLGIETVGDPGYASAETDVTDDDEFVMEAETEMVFLQDCGEASFAQASRFRTFSLGLYEDSYGDQLEDNSLIVYQGMENTWAQGNTSNIECKLSTPYTFVTDGTIETNDQNEKVPVWDKTSSEYREVLTQMGYDVQSAFDAFVYDYPEVFWLGRVNYSFGIGFYRIEGSDTQLRGRISSVTVCGVGETTDSKGNSCLREKYAGAPEEVGEFESAVNDAVTKISSSLPENADHWDIVKAVHDYICNTVSYGENEYAHTAAGVFHKEPKVVVCEGYAKAMKILCRRFGITSALIVGNALKSNGTRENHMWNYIRMEDGKWYLVDPTWDDQSGGIRYTYFLAGSGSWGFNSVISTERQNYTSFSEGNFTNFTLPQLSETHYYLWELVSETSATCTAGFRKTYQCRKDSTTKKTEVGKPLDHEWASEWTVDEEAGCTTVGKKSHHCIRCDAIKDETDIPAGHLWQEVSRTQANCTSGAKVEYKCVRDGCTETYSVDENVLDPSNHDWAVKMRIEATCVSGEETIYQCSGCQAEKSSITKEPLGHEFSTQWTVDREATCTQTGEKSRHCMREDCDERTEPTEIPMTDHSWDSGKITRAATCDLSGIRTYTCTVCGKTKTETIAPLGHEYGGWVTKTPATVLKTGIQIRTCSHCGAVITKSVPKLKRTIKLNVTKLPLQAGKSTGAVKVIKMTDGDYIKKWTSSNTKIASVSKKGVITGKKAGTATITVTLASGAKASVKVTVQKKKVETTALAVQGKTTVIRNNKLILKKGKKETLITKLTPLTSSEKVTYAVSNKKIVTVSAKGVVTARKSGTARITVRSGKKKVVLKVTVK